MTRGSWLRESAFTVAAAVIVMFALPLLLGGTYTPTVLAIYGMLGLSLGLVWGFGGILCFGQAAFFGLGAYAYAIGAINMGESTLPMLVAVLVPGAFAALLGAMMFYGRLGDVYLAIITLVVTLILYRFMNSTAGSEYVIGAARLGGFNGIPGFQTLNVPGRPDLYIWGDDLYYACFVALVAVYGLVTWLLRSSFGRIAWGSERTRRACRCWATTCRRARPCCSPSGPRSPGWPGRCSRAGRRS